MTAVGATGAGILERAPRRRLAPHRIVGSIIMLGLAVFSVWSLLDVDFSWARITRGLNTAAGLIAKSDPISFPSIGDLAYLIGLTLGIVVLGTLLAAVISIPIAYGAARNTTPAKWVMWICRGLGVLSRAFPDYVIAVATAMMFVVNSTLPGVLAFGIHSIGMISKLYADAIEQIDEGPVVAIRAAGGSKAQQFWSGVFPQVLPSWIATTLHRADINLRASVIFAWAGIGGLGLRLKNDLQDFPESLGAAIGDGIVIILLCIAFEIVSSTIRRNLLGIRPRGGGTGTTIVRLVTRGRPAPPRSTSPAAFHPASPEEALRRPWTAQRVRNLVWILVALVVVAGSFWTAEVFVYGVNWGQFWPTMASFFPLSTGGHPIGDYFEALLDTLKVAAAATVLAFVLSLVFGSLAARNVAPNGWVRNAFRVLITIIRGFPEIVVALLLIMVTGLGNQAGTVALAFGGIGLLGKLIADSFEEVPNGPETALSAAGATRPQRYFSATLPQGMQSLIGNTMYLLDTNFRASSVLGVVGGAGVGVILFSAAGLQSTHGQITTLVLMIAGTVLLIEALSQYLRWAFK